MQHETVTCLKLMLALCAMCISASLQPRKQLEPLARVNSNLTNASADYLKVVPPECNFTQPDLISLWTRIHDLSPWLERKKITQDLKIIIIPDEGDPNRFTLDISAPGITPYQVRGIFPRHHNPDCNKIVDQAIEDLKQGLNLKPAI